MAQFRIGTWNVCNGLARKKDYVKRILDENDLDVLFIQEAEITKETPTSILMVGGYEIEISRSNSKARLACYIKTGVNYKRITEKENTNVLKLEIERNNKVTQIIGVYRPFKLNEGHNNLSQFKEQVKEMTDFMKDN